MSQATPDGGALLGVIETDVFCGKCGFNLHTQKVWRDERLGIPVCRCPECGAIDAAGRNTATSSAWLKRLAVVGLLAWLVMALAFVVGTGLLMFGAQMAAPEGVLYQQLETRDTGKPVESTTNSNPPLFTTLEPNDSNRTYTADEVILRPRFASWITGDERAKPAFPYYYTNETQLVQFIFVTVLFAVPHVFSAVVIPCMIWFWRRRYQWVWVLLPSVAMLFSLTLWWSSLRNETWLQVERSGFRLYAAVIISVGVLQTLLVVLGLLIGRSIGRFVVSLFVPPKARQLFAFLWHCDGKTMPPARTNAERMDG